MKTIITLLLIIVLSNSAYSDWEHMVNGTFPQSVAYDYTIFNNKLILSAEYGRFYSTNSGFNWDWTDFNIRWASCLGSNDDRLFIGTMNNGIMYSTNVPGANWVQTSYTAGNVNTLLVLGNTIFAGTTVGISVSRDNGETWNIAYAGSLVTGIKIGKDGTLYAAANSNGVFKSTDKGFTWFSTGLVANVFDVAIQGNKIYAGYLYGVVVSEDNGSTWSTTPITIPVRKLYADENFIFAGGFETGVYVSSNSGANWLQRNDNGIGNYTIRSIITHNNYVFIGTEGQGVYRRQLDELTAVHVTGTEIPSEYSLMQNYPNPFNPQTKILFSIPAGVNNSAVEVKLAIYDVMGKEIEVLANGNYKPGKYEAVWNGTGFSSGVYFYVLKTNDFTETKKMTLVK